jgi:hypothetical protein
VVLSLLFVSLSAAQVAADPITVVGASPFNLLNGSALWNADSFFTTGFFIPKVWTLENPTAPTFDGFGHITAGPQTNLVVETDATGQPTAMTYTFADAQFSVVDAFGDSTYAFVAPIPDFTFTILFDGLFAPFTFNYFDLGPGLFGAGLAEFMGVEQQTFGGQIYFSVEAIHFSEDTGFFYSGGTLADPTFSIEAETASVPEPSTLLVFLIGIGAGIRRMNRASVQCRQVR